MCRTTERKVQLFIATIYPQVASEDMRIYGIEFALRYAVKVVEDGLKDHRYLIHLANSVLLSSH